MTRKSSPPVLRDLGFEWDRGTKKNWGSSILVLAPQTGERFDLLDLPDKRTARSTLDPSELFKPSG